MWYVLYCPNQKETEVIRSCRRRLSAQALTDAFVLTYDRMRRYEGAWHTERKPLFPDCVFLESGDEESLVKELGEIGKQPESSGTKNGYPALVPVQKEEEAFLQSLCGSERHSALSKGYIRDGHTCVTEGPLVGKEAYIQRIDRHKRLAELSLPSGNGRMDVPRKMCVGLEIVEKG